jgi:hypothetical protein
MVLYLRSDLGNERQTLELRQVIHEVRHLKSCVVSIATTIVGEEDVIDLVVDYLL